MQIAGSGTFDVSKRNVRTGQNLQAGKEIQGTCLVAAPLCYMQKYIIDNFYKCSDTGEQDGQEPQMAA